MREVNLAGLDLNLLPALEALLRVRNVTKAAAEIGLSQPAMSRALARLREIFADPLLVRIGGGLSPTPAAEALQPKVAAALEDLRGLFRPPAIDPAELKRTFRLAAADAQTILIAPHLVARLEREAPGVDLAFSSIGRDILGRMEQGEVDICFAVTGTPLPLAPSARSLRAIAWFWSCGAATQRRTGNGQSPTTPSIGTPPCPSSAMGCPISTPAFPRRASSGGSA